MNKQLTIRVLDSKDYEVCATIYGDGLRTGMATFETEVPTWEQWNAKFLKQCRYVAVVQNEVIGWIALAPFSSRPVYGGVAEVSLYIAVKSRGQGVGNRLLEKVISQSKKDGFWTLQAKIFPQNKPSLKLFEACGFRKVGVREKLGMRDGVWYDNILLELRM